MKYELYINGYLWYVDNEKKTISETKDFKNESFINDCCTKSERRQIEIKINYGEARLLN